MCIVRTKTRIHSDGQRETVEQQELCGSSVGNNLCNRVIRENLGQERINEIVPDSQASSSRSNKDPVHVHQRRGDGPKKIYIDLNLPSLGLGKKKSRRRRETDRVVIHQTTPHPLERIVEVMPEGSSSSSTASDSILESLPSRRESSSAPPTLDAYPRLPRGLSPPLPRVTVPPRRSPSPPLLRSSMRRPAQLNIPERLSSTPPSPVLSSPGLSRLREQRNSRHDSGYAPSPISSPTDSEHFAREQARSSLRRQREERDRASLAQSQEQDRIAEDERQASIERGRLTARDEMRAARVHFTPSPASSAEAETRERHRQKAYERLTATREVTPELPTERATPERVIRRYHYPDPQTASSTGGYQIHRTSWPRSNRSSGSEAVRRDQQDGPGMERARAAAARMQDGMERMQNAMERVSVRSDEWRYSDSYYDDTYTRRRKRRQDGQARDDGDGDFYD